MNLDDIKKEHPYGERDTPYKNSCDNCGKEHTLYTQQDNYPEYYTDVYLKCDCRNIVKFELPVN